MQKGSIYWRKLHFVFRNGFCTELLEVIGAGDLRIERAVVGDIVTVAAAGAGLEQRRQVAAAYPQFIQIGNQLRCLPQIEITIYLQRVSRPGDLQLHLHGSLPSAGPGICNTGRSWRSASNIPCR